MTRADWLALAERCQKATEADREIDEGIADGTLAEKRRTCIKGLSDKDGGMWMWRDQNGDVTSAPRVTASLDAITGLIERELAAIGWDVAHDIAFKQPPGASIWWTDSKGAHWLERHRSVTPALALCAAFCAAMAERAEV